MQYKKTALEKQEDLPETVKRIQAILDREGISQRKFSGKMGWSHTHLASVMRQENILSGSMLKRMADAGYDITWVLTGHMGERVDDGQVEYLTQRVRDLEFLVAAQRQMMGLCQTALSQLLSKT